MGSTSRTWQRRHHDCYPRAADDVYSYADQVETGEILGPRVYTTGPGVFSGIGLEDKESVNNYIKRYSEAYKTNTLKQYVVGDRMVRQLVAIATKENNITPTTEGALDMKLNISQIATVFRPRAFATIQLSTRT